MIDISHDTDITPYNKLKENIYALRQSNINKDAQLRLLRPHQESYIELLVSLGRADEAIEARRALMACSD